MGVNDLIVGMSTDSGNDSDDDNNKMGMLWIEILKFGQIFNFHKGAWLFVRTADDVIDYVIW